MWCARQGDRAEEFTPEGLILPCWFSEPYLPCFQYGHSGIDRYWQPCNDVETWIKKKNYYIQNSACSLSVWGPPKLIRVNPGTRYILEKYVECVACLWWKTRRQAVRVPKAMAEHNIVQHCQRSAQARVLNSPSTYLTYIFVIASLNWQSLFQAQCSALQESMLGLTQWLEQIFPSHSARLMSKDFQSSGRSHLDCWFEILNMKLQSSVRRKGTK